MRLGKLISRSNLDLSSIVVVRSINESKVWHVGVVGTTLRGSFSSSLSIEKEIIPVFEGHLSFTGYWNVLKHVLNQNLRPHLNIHMKHEWKKVETNIDYMPKQHAWKSCLVYGHT